MRDVRRFFDFLFDLRLGIRRASGDVRVPGREVLRRVFRFLRELRLDLRYLFRRYSRRLSLVR